MTFTVQRRGEAGWLVLGTYGDRGAAEHAYTCALEIWLDSQVRMTFGEAVLASVGPAPRSST